jgi:1-pyrroline-5-carboxylate dehydrogenase
MTQRKQIKVTYSTLASPEPELHEYFEEALAKARANLGQTHQLYLNGQWRKAEKNFTTVSPIDTSLVMGHFGEGSAKEIDEAMAAAKAAFPAWRDTPWQERVALLRKVAALISERMFDIAAVNSLEVGKNRLEALGDVEEAADFVRVYYDTMEAHNGFSMDNLQENERITNQSVLKPYGVWGVVAPFNFPIALSCGPSAAALIAGNTVVLKPAEDTPYGPSLLAECFADAGLPAGVFNMITGGKETGRLLVEHPDIAGVTFTGSYRVGMEIYAKVAQGANARPVLAEMGGKNAVIISKNADLDKAAQGVMRSAFGLQGQKCSACSRVYVDEAVKDAFVQKLVELTKEITIGDPTLRQNWMGPVSTRKAYENYQAYIADIKAAGGKILAGGQTLDGKGYYVAPTVVEALPEDHRLWQYEMFAPIVTIAGVHNLDEAMRKANAVQFGLTAGFFSEDEGEIRWFLNNIEAGVVYVNRATGATTGAWPRYQPFGGWKGSTTTGRGSGGAYYLQQYMREQSQTVVR